MLFRGIPILYLAAHEQ